VAYAIGDGLDFGLDGHDRVGCWWAGFDIGWVELWCMLYI